MKVAASEGHKEAYCYYTIIYIPDIEKTGKFPQWKWKLTFFLQTCSCEK